MADHKNDMDNNNEVVSWIIIVAALAFFWPIGLVLLFRKLSGGGGKSIVSRSVTTTRTTSSRIGTAEPGTQGVYESQTVRERTVRRRTEAGPAPAARTVRRRTPAEPKSLSLKRGRSMMIAGGVFTGVSAVAVLGTVFEIIDSILYGWFSFRDIGELFVPAGMCGVGLVLLTVGLRENRRSKRFRKYLALIGRQESVPVERLAQAMPVSVHTACADLQEMLDEGLFPTGFLDMAQGRLILSGEGIRVEAPVTKKPGPVPAQDEDERTLARIRAVNDAIEDPVMSAKIDRIEEITRKIFAYQKKEPEKGGQLRTFLNYYLPTTLKILDSYAQLEEQGVEGENITTAKARIEGMMDKVVEGFEKQLDKLFEDTAMDITTDVKVLEQMLEKDGLSGGPGGMTLGL
ncbi:5-bromo-4-chloroindolyl phosphate hydrolysis family protein [Pseudoflavonifractor sp. MSJ-37]|uniref:5-bromo-4-chloroindolyl phosphate hydrolysis family protein n=1 Tax=Pseudoflavonifractor sp. MSJ-37 TaxID=2841531 RepID=UPI001C110B7F|nr:5-bromo-4-chloroindolyl phosphate hydrolysis family protein [Pseudoflavonifractor sp. MSJ-37]MBU5434538.1 5-bromo-4-chloroindolyl phosphate hydrolysis family protein [Pseudoflavonifractor sp. MSJ-37]